MITIKKEEELLALSGLQHLAFCERQWALIHLEGLWAENRPTMEGRFLHERVNDPFFDESRGEVLITRSVPWFPISWVVRYRRCRGILPDNRYQGGG